MVWIAGANGVAGATTFSSIPQTFTHLQLRIYARGLTSNPTSNMYLAGGPASHYLQGDGASATSTSQTGLSYQFIAAGFPAATATANVYSNYVIDLLDYTSTNKNKTWRILGGFDANGSGRVFLASGLWVNLSAITSFFIDTESGFTSATRFDLYGITSSQVTGA